MDVIKSGVTAFNIDIQHAEGFVLEDDWVPRFEMNRYLG
jgi:hypothetical protein